MIFYSGSVPNYRLRSGQHKDASTKAVVDAKRVDEEKERLRLIGNRFSVDYYYSFLEYRPRSGSDRTVTEALRNLLSLMLGQ